jgi:hypothetical protein
LAHNIFVTSIYGENDDLYIHFIINSKDKDMKKLGRKNLDELRKIMPVVNDHELKTYVGGADLQCIIDAMLNNSNGYFNPNDCFGNGAGGQYSGTVALGGQSFTAIFSFGSYTYHPNVSAVYYYGGPSNGVTISGEDAYIYKFGNQTSTGSFGEMWILVPASVSGVMDNYFGNN